MLQETPDNLDALIREEKRRVAVEFIEEAWNSALQEGIEPSILADGGLVALLTKLHEHDGATAVEDLIETLTHRLESGQFDSKRILQ